MPRPRPTPLGGIAGGAVAGVAGTLAMDLVWYRRYRAGGGTDGFTGWEFSSGTEGYDGAGAPATIGKRIVESVFDVSLPPSTAGSMNNAVHWLTGTGWGVVHGILAGSLQRPRLWLGALTGATAFAASYAVLAPAGIYQPPWEYDAETLWRDLSAHLVFGTVTGLAFQAVRSAPGR